MKLCKNCKHARISWFDYFFMSGWRFAKCWHESATKPVEISPVTGRPLGGEGQYFCITQRSTFAKCGPGAKYFESKTECQT